MTNEELAHIDAAVTAHGQWLNRLRAAIHTGACEFKPAEVHADDRCAFGRWLHGDFPAALRGTAVYEDIRRTHAQFHQQAAGILSLALAGRKAEAERLMGPQSEFLSLSGWLIVKLRTLKTAAPERRASL
jgi:methyl-accepting chemotaxis protein